MPIEKRLIDYDILFDQIDVVRTSVVSCLDGHENVPHAAWQFRVFRGMENQCVREILIANMADFVYIRVGIAEDSDIIRWVVGTVYCLKCKSQHFWSLARRHHNYFSWRKHVVSIQR